MKDYLRVTALSLVVLAFAACGGSDETPEYETPPEAPPPAALPEETAALPEESAAPEPEASPEAAAEEDPEAVSLPADFPEALPLIEGFTVKTVAPLEGGQTGYTVTGHAPMDEVAVMNWYVRKWKELGWQEDMLMEQHANTIVGYHIDNLFVMVDSSPAPGGANLIITTWTD